MTDIQQDPLDEGGGGKSHIARLQPTYNMEKHIHIWISWERNELAIPVFKRIKITYTLDNAASTIGYLGSNCKVTKVDNYVNNVG